MTSGIRLLPYDSVHAQTVAAWPESPDELWNWAARRDYPLKAAVLRDWHFESDVEPWLLFHRETVVGYGEIWYEVDGSSAELGHLIVAPGFRGKGVGKQLVHELSAIISRHGINEHWLRVDPGNQRAIACYRAAGFSHASDDVNAQLNRNQRYEFLWMFKSVDIRKQLASLFAKRVLSEQQAT